jgi:hypothetical protein
LTGGAAGDNAARAASDSADFITDWGNTDVIVFQSATLTTGTLSGSTLATGQTATDYQGAVSLANLIMSGGVFDVVAIQAAGNTYVFLDDDGTAAGGTSADQVIVLTGLHTLTAANFKVAV